LNTKYIDYVLEKTFIMNENDIELFDKYQNRFLKIVFESVYNQIRSREDDFIFPDLDKTKERIVDFAKMKSLEIFNETENVINQRDSLILKEALLFEEDLNKTDSKTSTFFNDVKEFFKDFVSISLLNIRAAFDENEAKLIGLPKIQVLRDQAEDMLYKFSRLGFELEKKRIIAETALIYSDCMRKEPEEKENWEDKKIYKLLVCTLLDTMTKIMGGFFIYITFLKNNQTNLSNINNVEDLFAKTNIHLQNKIFIDVLEPIHKDYIKLSQKLLKEHDPREKISIIYRIDNEVKRLCTNVGHQQTNKVPNREKFPRQNDKFDGHKKVNDSSWKGREQTQRFPRPPTQNYAK